jgi:hypothetical protein
VVSPEQNVLGRLTGFQSASQLDARLASYAPAAARPAPYQRAPYQPVPYHRAAVRPAPSGVEQSYAARSRPAPATAPERRPWGQRTRDAIRASHQRTTLEAAIAFGTSR